MSDGYEVVDHAETALDATALNKILQWLQPTDYLAESGEFRRHLSSQAPGTGLWICEKEEYRKWHDSDDHGSLWIKGIPGAGKSVIAASLIQHLRTTEPHPVLFFFFRNIVSANFSPRALIQDWLAQLLPHSAKLQFALHDRMETPLPEISEEELFQLFLGGLSCVTKVYCIADALDEMESNSRQGPFLDRLNRLATYRSASLKLLLTSRPKRHLQSALRDSSIVHMSLQQSLVDIDIVAYLRHRFEDDELSGLNLGSAIRQQIIEIVAGRSEGLFLYAKLAVDQILRDIAGNDYILVEVKSLEASLPVGLEQTYSAMLAKQRQKDGVTVDLQVHVLEAVTHSARPLRLNELTCLTKSIYPKLQVPTSGLKSLISSCCGSLVEVLEDETLQVIHHSFTEFLRGDSRGDTQSVDRLVTDFPVINSKEAHRRMAVNCLQYLKSGSMLLDGESDTGGANKEALALIYRLPGHKRDHDWDFPERKNVQVDPFNYRNARLLHSFLAYAVDYWPYHAHHYDARDDDFYAAIASFLDPNSLAFLRWLILKWGTTSETRGSTDGIPTALHIAAFVGLSNFTSTLLSQDAASVSANDAQLRIPLHWAAENGHHKVAKLLLEHGSDPNAEDGRGLKPIHLAAKNNHAAVLKLLLQARVPPNTIKTKEDDNGRVCGGSAITIGEDAIQYAAERGHDDCLIEMVPFCKPETLERLLCECCMHSRTVTVLAILERTNVSPDAMHQKATALSFACRMANVKVVDALLKHGADVGKMSGWIPPRRLHGPRHPGESMSAPIHILVGAWWENNDEACRAILRRLLEAGADLEHLDEKGRTPLALAVGSVSYGHYPARARLQMHALRALLDLGADFNRIYNGKLPIHVASMFNHLEAIQTLSERGCDLNQKDAAGDTPLLCAMRDLREGKETALRVINYFLGQGVDVSCRDNHGYTALTLAMSIDVDLFRTLLSRCEDDSVKKECWFKLSNTGKVSNGEFSKFLKLLLAEGIDVNTRDARGKTLYLRCLADSEKLVILEEHGADPCVVDDDGRNALFNLSKYSWDRERQHREMERLIAAGLDARSTDGQGNTLLHLTAGDTNWKGDADHVKWLLGLGIQLSAVNKKGQTALHMYLHCLGPTSTGATTEIDDEHIHFFDAVGSVEEALNILDNNGLAVVHLAAMTSESELAKMIKIGADLGLLTEDSQNILHLACRAGRPSILCQILNHNTAERVDINQKDGFGLVPLHVASASGSAESVALLLKYGADVHTLGHDSMTALHYCAQFPLEQGIWDSLTFSHSQAWLRGPPADALRTVPASWPGGSPWYTSTSSEGFAQARRTVFSSVGGIAKLLIKAGIDIAALNDYNFTALDIALSRNCADFVEIFATDEGLFQAATGHLRTDNAGRGVPSWEVVSRRLIANMALVRPRSALVHLRDHGPAFEDVLQSPQRYLSLLNVHDAAAFINEAFAAEPSRPWLYGLLPELLKPEMLAIAYQVTQLVRRYGTCESAREYIEISKENGDKYYENPALTSLQWACRTEECNLETLRFLVETVGVDVNANCAVDKNSAWQSTADILPGGTALHVLADAQQYWQVEGLRYLLTHCATTQVDALDERGESPLHCAAGKEPSDKRGFWSVAAIRVLLDHGADPNLLDKDGLSPLYKASESPGAIQELLRGGANPALGKRLPLFEVISAQNHDGLGFLLDSGVDINSVDDTRSASSLHYELTKERKLHAVVCSAFASGVNMSVSESLPLLRTLVTRGADLYLPLNDDETVIHFLFEFTESAVHNALLEDPCVTRIDFSRRDQQGRTILMAACAAHRLVHHDSLGPGTPSPLTRILEHGCDPTLVDKSGKTALHHLLTNEHPFDDVITEFVNLDAVRPILLLKDNDGYTPLHYALRCLRPQICELLLSKGANLVDADPNGQTALHHIANQINRIYRPSPTSFSENLPFDYPDKCLALWNRFLSEGGSINTPDKDGNRPLHTYLLSNDRSRRSASDPAFKACHMEFYNKLFTPATGVDIFAVNNNGETMLHVLARRTASYYSTDEHDKEMFLAMVTKGLDPLREDAKGRSALDVASACDKEVIVAALGRK